MTVVDLTAERERRRVQPVTCDAAGGGWPKLQHELTEVPDLHIVSCEERAPERLGPDSARSSDDTQLELEVDL